MGAGDKYIFLRNEEAPAYGQLNWQEFSSQCAGKLQCC